jgi:hypothetical protein
MSQKPAPKMASTTIQRITPSDLLRFGGGAGS